VVEAERVQLLLELGDHWTRVVFLARAPDDDLKVLVGVEQQLAHVLSEADVEGHSLELELAVDGRQVGLVERGLEQALLQAKHERLLAAVELFAEPLLDSL